LLNEGGTATLLAGQAACLAAALLWAVAVTLFRRPIEVHGARTINTGKCLLAAVLQGLTVLLLGQAGALTAAPLRSTALIVLSGLIGLVLGDTALFGAVARIGVHRTLLLQTLAPVFAAVVALAWQGEVLTDRQMAGTVLVLAGIALVVAPQRGAGRVNSGLAAGFTLAVIAAFGQGAGVVLAKEGMQEYPYIAASFLRLAAAAAGLFLLEALMGRSGRLVHLARDGAAMIRSVPATLLGTYLALFLMMAGIALAPASAVATVLLGTSPVFSLFLEAAVEKKRITARGAIGTLLAVAGVGVLSVM
jgi:drug/metabolite transporter (DMT)-like permease